MRPWLIFLALKKSTFKLRSPFRFKQGFIIGGVILALMTMYTRPTLLSQTQSSLLDVTAYGNHWYSSPAKAFESGINYITSHFQTQAQNQKLREENSVLRNRYYQALSMAAENHRLRQKLKIIDEESPTFISARVIGGADTPYQKNILLNGGTKAGIQVKNAVLLNQQILGRVIETGTYACRVLLITDPQSHIPIVLEKSGIQGILSGDASSLMRIKVSEKSFVSLKKLSTPLDGTDEEKTSPKVEKGEYVFTSGQGGVFPPGFVTGRVVDINDNEILVEALWDLSQLEYVQIHKPIEIFQHD